MGYCSFQIGCVIVEYGLFNTTNLKQNLIYIRFGIILTQFYINFSRQEHQIDVLYVTFKPRDSQVLVYTPIHFSFTVPLIEKTFLSHSGLISSFLQIFQNPFIPFFILLSFLPFSYLPSIFLSNLLLFSN